MEWKSLVNDPEEQLVFSALDDPQWSWRTLQGLHDATGLAENRILAVLAKYPDLVRTGQSQRRGTIYQLLNRTEPPEEAFIDKALDYLTLGRRRIA